MLLLIRHEIGSIQVRNPFRIREIKIEKKTHSKFEIKSRFLLQGKRLLEEGQKADWSKCD